MNYNTRLAKFEDISFITNIYNQGIEDKCASINVFYSRCCYSGVGDLSIYIERSMRGKGLGKLLINYLIEAAKKMDFYK